MRRPKLSVLVYMITFGTLLIVAGTFLGFKVLPEYVRSQIWQVSTFFTPTYLFGRYIVTVIMTIKPAITKTHFLLT